MAADIGAKIGLDGEKEFKNALQTTVTKIKTLQSSMTALASEFKAGNISQEDYEKEAKRLQTEISGQKGKLKDLQSELNTLSEKYKDDTATADKFQRQINNGVKAANDAAAAAENLGKETEKSGNEMDKAAGQAKGFSDVLKGNLLSSAITAGIKAIAGAVKEVSKALVGVVEDSAAFADEILTLSAETGIGTKKLQELSYASDLVDVSVDTITKAMAKNIKSMSSARNESKNYVDAYEKIGVAVTNADGSLRDSEVVFWEIIDALGGMDNETERDAAAMQLLGKSAQELNPLIKAGSQRMKDLAYEAAQMGYVLDDEALSSLGSTQDAMDRMTLATDAAKRKLGAQLAPVITEVIGKITELASSIDMAAIGEKLSGALEHFVSETIPKILEGLQWIKENGDMIISVLAGIAAGFVAFEVASTIMGVVNAVKAFKAADEGAAVAQTALNTAMDANPALLIAKIILSVVSAITVFILTNEEARAKVAAVWASIKNAFSNAFDAIKATIEKIGLAFANLWDGILQKVTDAKNWGRDLIQNFINGLLAKWEALKQKVKDIAQSIKDFLGFSEPKKGPLSDFHTYAPDMMELFAKGISDNENLVKNQLAKSFDFGKFYANGTAGSAPSYNISLSINGAGISDPNALADLVIAKLSNQIANTRGVYE